MIKHLRLITFHIKCVLFTTLLLWSANIASSTKEKNNVGNYSEQNKKELKGVIVDTNGETLPRVHIRIKGNDKIYISDIDGNFAVSVEIGDVLSFSSVGFITKEITVKSHKRLRIHLEDNIIAMQEYIVTGYQTLSKERATGSYATINTANIERKMQSSLTSLLEGQVAGLTINKGGGMEIRGVSTFSAGSSPLIVVDGYPYEGTLESLNADNIENITVLKDAVSASIYGVRAANGVIVVTTKRGSGKMRISYKGVLNVASKPNLDYLNLANTSDYIDAEMEFFNLLPSWQINNMFNGNISRVNYLLASVKNGTLANEEAMKTINSLRNINGLKELEKHLFRESTSQQHSVNISGGDQVYNYNAALNYRNSKGRFIHTDSERIMFDMKNGWKPTSFISITSTIDISHSKNNSPREGYSSLITYDSRTHLKPYTNLFENDGSLSNIWGLSPMKISEYEKRPEMKNWDYNPISDTPKRMNSSESTNIRIGSQMKVTLSNALNLDLGGVWQRGNMINRSINDHDSYLVRIGFNDFTNRNNPSEHIIPEGSIIDETRGVSNNWTLRSQLNFDKRFSDDKHSISVIVGGEIRKTSIDNNKSSTRVGFNPQSGSFSSFDYNKYKSGEIYANTLFRNYNMGLTEGAYMFDENRFVSTYSNASYIYDGKYILTGSVRMDLTNLFGTDPKYRYRPLWSIGGTYKIKEEPFFNAEYIDRLNIRSSYGVNGNISLNEGPFLILSDAGYSDRTDSKFLTIQSPPNNQLRWERTKSLNLGADLTLLRNRLNMSLDLYLKISDDLLSRHEVDPTTGFSDVRKNEGEMINKGIETTINYRLINQSNLKWDVIYNFAYNNNIVKKTNYKPSTATHFVQSSSQGLIIQDYPTSSIWGYKFAGLNEQGTTTIYNKADERIYPANAKVEDVVFLGSFRPKYEMSLTNAISYKNWDFSCMFIAKLGHKYRKDAFAGSNYQNRYVSQRWKKPGDEKNTIYPALQYQSYDSGHFPFIDELIGNASFMKLRDVTISYTFDKKLIERISLGGVKAHLQLRNLFRITAKGTDIDPETAEVSRTSYFGGFAQLGFTSLPMPKEIFIGLSITI